MSEFHGLLKAAEKNKHSITQKRFSLDVGPAKKLPKKQVDPKAIKALLDRQEKERQQERSKLITKAVESTKRDERNYKDKHGIRKVEQEHSEKCKKQYLKIQKEKREFINRMHKSADERDKNKKARDADEVINSLKEKDAIKRKRKYEVFHGTIDKKPKKEFTPIKGPVITDMNEILRIAQTNVESDAFGSMTNPLKELEKRESDKETTSGRLLTASEKKKLEQTPKPFSLPRIPKVGSSENGRKPAEKKPTKEKDPKSNESLRPAKHGEPVSKSSKEKASKDRKVVPDGHKVKSEKSKSNGSRPSEPSRSQITSKSNGFAPKTEQRNGNLSNSNGIKKPHAPIRNGSSLKPVKANSNGIVKGVMRDENVNKLREQAARQLEQLRAEKLKDEEEKKRLRILSKKVRMAEEQRLKKKLQALQSMDSEDEDMDEYEDDFIDDAPIDDPYAKNYSKHIAQIYKYDRSKYAMVDDEDIEESSFTRCMAEEARSARLGRQEDLEDMRKEEELLRKKSAGKNKKLEELAKRCKEKKKLTLCPV